MTLTVIILFITHALGFAIGMMVHSLIIEREDRIAKEKIRKGEVDLDLMALTDIVMNDSSSPRSDLDPRPARAGFFTSPVVRTTRKENLMIVITVLDILIPRLVTIPVERAEVPVQKELDRMRAELEEIIDDYEKTIRSLNK